MAIPNVDVVVSGPVQASCTYKTVILKGNLSFASQLGDENCRYVIKWDYNLNGQTITIPEGCILDFQGGSISSGTIVGQNTYIAAPAVRIFGQDAVLSGTWKFEYSYAEWFGAERDGVTDDTIAIQKSVDLTDIYGGTTLLKTGVYKVSGINLKTKTNLKGEGIGATILKSDTSSSIGIVNVPQNSVQCVISGLSLIGNKTQHGIYVYPVTLVGDATYPMSYYLQENTGIENNKQTYRNLTIDTVYVGTCNHGISFNDKAYRTIVQNCDIKRCVYGINFYVTDSDLHDVYIERCDRSGFVCRGANNNVTDLKSIWNGLAAPYESYGLELRGTRNRYMNIEAQDNYCSGIATSGNDNKYVNVVANGDGFAYDASLDDENDGLCEWYVNTLTSEYVNCSVTNYSTRQVSETSYLKPFPKYPVKYGADGVVSNQIVRVEGDTLGTFVAREPINIPDILPTSNIFDIYSDAVMADIDSGYLISETLSQDLKTHILLSGQMTIVLELSLDGLVVDNTMSGYSSVKINGLNDLYVYLSQEKKVGLRKNDTTVAEVNIENALLTKPIRIAASIAPVRKDTITSEETTYNRWHYDISLSVWYYDNTLRGGCYSYGFERVPNFTVIRNNTLESIGNVSFNALWNDEESVNPFYLRTFAVSEVPEVPCSVSYPNASITHLNPVISFDYRSVHGDMRPDVGSTGRRPSRFINKGYSYYDEDLNIPLWWDGESWNPANGKAIPIEQNTNINSLKSVGEYTCASGAICGTLSGRPADLINAGFRLLIRPFTGSMLYRVLIANEDGAIWYAKSSSAPITWGDWMRINLSVAGTAVSGTTANRPSITQLNARDMIGFRYFDTTLGKPIFVKSISGSTVTWVDATGATV